MITATNTRSTVRQRKPESNSLKADPDLLLKLYELLQGERDVVSVYSKALECTVHFVNPGVADMEAIADLSPVYTTRELAFVLSLSEEELRRYHYLKLKLID